MINTIDNNGAMILEQTINGTFGDVTLRYVKATDDEPSHYVALMFFPGCTLRNSAQGETAAIAVRSLYAAYANSVATQDGIGY